MTDDAGGDRAVTAHMCEVYAEVGMCRHLEPDLALVFAYRLMDSADRISEAFKGIRWAIQPSWLADGGDA